MSFVKVSLTQTNDYIAVKTDTFKSDSFSINLVGTFDGATISLIRAFTNKLGEMDLLHQAPIPDGNEIEIEYTKPQAISLSGILQDNWYIFKLNNANDSTNVEVCISGIKQVIENTASLKQNIITNNLEIEIV